MGATLPPGFTRTFLPAVARPALAVAAGAPILPQWAYTAAAATPGRLRGLGAPHRSPRPLEPRPPLHPRPRPARVAARLAATPNPIYRQLSRCALEWRCFTAQNTFYGRDEGAIPSSARCNAACVGCLSRAGRGHAALLHERIAAPAHRRGDGRGGAPPPRPPARGQVMVSFGQGCEGEPLLRWKEIARAIRLVRARTSRGSLHVNTNGSLPRGPRRALRGRPRLGAHLAQQRRARPLRAPTTGPRGYGLADVVRSIETARRAGAYVALNLLTFPGVTDREGEVEALAGLVRRSQGGPGADPPAGHRPGRLPGGGARPRRRRARRSASARLVAALRAARPGLVVGNFSRARPERIRAEAAQPRTRR